MNDNPTPARMDVRPAQAGMLRRLSLIWLVPLLALIISLGVAYQNYANQGTLIEIIFENASGISAGETVIKYRDVVVGRVEDIEFAEGLGDVLVHARIDNKIAPYLDDDAQFWVIEPDVSLRGISGLETVLSGVFIEGTWDTEADVQQYFFAGLEEPPLTRATQRGTQVTLRTRDGGSLADGAPVLHKGIQVGYLETPKLDADGTGVTVNAFIEAPFDKRITSATRFWDTSGFSVSVGAAGLSLDVSSLASLIEGGVAFDTVMSGGESVDDGHIFDLFGAENEARDSLFADPNQAVLEVAVLFERSVSGLTKGAEVRFQGIRIGTVRELNAIVVDDRDQAQVQLRTVLAIEPARLGMGSTATPEEALGFLSDFVRQGLRARMVTGNILSGSLVVELIEVPDAPLAVLDVAAKPYPVIPTTASDITDVADSAESVLNRINNLPVEDLLTGAIDLMDSLERLANDDSLREAPESLVALLEETRGLIASDDFQNVPADVRALIGEAQALVASDDMQAVPSALRNTVDDINAVVAEIAARDLLGKLTRAIDSTTVAVDSVPPLTSELQVLTEKVNALDVESLLVEATQTLANIDALIASEGIQSLPATAQTALDEMQLLMADARTLVASEDLQAVPGDLRAAVAQLDSVIAQVNEADLVSRLGTAIDTATQAVESIDIAATDLPAITAELQALAEKANALEIDTLINEAAQTLETIDTLLGADGTQDLPAQLGSALDEVRGFIGEVRDGGAITNVNAALAAANEAAQAIERAAADLPDLSNRANALMSQTQGVLDSYSDRSRFNAETLATLRDIQAAADAVSSLARAIQRNPNSLLTGR